MGSRKRRTQGRDSAVLKAAATEGVVALLSSSFERYTCPVALERAAARLRRRTGGYVSGMVRAPRIHRAPVKIAIRPSTHRHPLVSPRNPPTIGPRVGPMKGAAAKTDMARPR